MAKTVPNFGPDSARLMVVGEAPGGYELIEGRPFVGPAGGLLRGCLSSVGIDPERDVFYANLCQDRPPSNELRAFFDEKGAPQAPVISGLGRLRADIERIKPNLIVPVGSYPLKFLTGKGTWKKADGYTGISTYRGSILPGTPFAFGTKCLPTYHPAAALRKYLFKHLIKADLGRAAEQQQFPDIRRPRKYILLDPRGSERDRWAEWLVSPPGTESPPFIHSEGDGKALEPITVPSGSFLTGDIEYVGSKLLCIGFTRHADVAIVFATRDIADVDYIRGILLSGIPLCFQNGMFDCSILEWFYDIACIKHLYHDTMIAMHAAYTEFPKDLGFITSIFTEQPVYWDQIGAAFWKEVRKATEGLKISLADYEAKYLPYNGIDVWVTHAAMESMLADELRDPHVASTYRHEMSLVRPLWDVGKVGVRIDTTKLEHLRSTLEREVATYNAGITFLNGGTEVNLKSGPQVAKFLYERMAISTVGAPKTPTGLFQMNDIHLANLQLKVKDERQRSALKMVREARERRDLISKFCDIELDDDGRMRCHYDPAKTDTGRLSSRKFYPTGRGTNLQNVPRDTRVRAVFVPDPGMVFAYADLKSAESLVVAHLTGDTEMLRLHSPEYMSGNLDGHKYVASFLLDKPIDRINKEERYLGKRVRHAGNYGMSWKKLMDLINADAQETGVSVDAAQAKRLITRYRQLHPMLQGWWNDVLLRLESTHTLYSCHGRKRVFYERPDEILPEGIAYDPQSTVAQTLNMGGILRLSPSYINEEDSWMRAYDVQKYGYDTVLKMIDKVITVYELGFQPLLQVHDAIGFQFPEASGAVVLPLVKELMDVPVPIRRRGTEPYEITIPVELQTGYNWGEFDAKQPEKNPNGLRPWHG